VAAPAAVQMASRNAPVRSPPRRRAVPPPSGD
jgi:hypothetical protein